MSENVCTESCITVKGDAYEDSKKRIVDIYVSAESLKVYENPWVEDTSPGPLASQHPVSVVSGNSRRSCARTTSLLKFAISLLLLAGILALICFGVEKKNKWRRDRNHLLVSKTNFTDDKFRPNNTGLK